MAYLIIPIDVRRDVEACNHSIRHIMDFILTTDVHCWRKVELSVTKADLQTIYYLIPTAEPISPLHGRDAGREIDSFLRNQ